MARKVRIVNARDFVSAKPDGTLNLEEREQPKTFAGRTAILCANERFDHAAFFALCAESKAVEMHAFTSYEEAIAWLHAPR